MYRPEPNAGLRARYARTDEAVLIHLSNFRPVKRISDCVHILAKVNPAIPSRLLMVGDGPDRVQAQALARELGLEERVIFLGKQIDVASLLAIADLLLLPSEMEGFGLAALEAMACGVPAIASDTGGLPEVIHHDRDGFLLPVGDIDGMAEAARNVLGDSARKKALGAAAREKALTRFSADKIIPQYEQYYRDVCGR